MKFTGPMSCLGKKRLNKSNAYKLIGRVKKDRKTDVRPYYCKRCGKYHITSLPKEMSKKM